MKVVENSSSYKFDKTLYKRSVMSTWPGTKILEGMGTKILFKKRDPATPFHKPV